MPNDKERAPIVTVPLSTTDAAVSELRNAGYIAIRTDTPDAVRIVVSGAQIESGDFVMSAMRGICEGFSDSNKRAFTDELYRRMKLQETRAAEILAELGAQ